VELYQTMADNNIKTKHRIAY